MLFGNSEVLASDAVRLKISSPENRIGPSNFRNLGDGLCAHVVVLRNVGSNVPLVPHDETLVRVAREMKT